MRINSKQLELKQAEWKRLFNRYTNLYLLRALIFCCVLSFLLIIVLVFGVLKGTGIVWLDITIFAVTAILGMSNIALLPGIGCFMIDWAEARADREVYGDES